MQFEVAVEVVKIVTTVALGKIIIGPWIQSVCCDVIVVGSLIGCVPYMGRVVIADIAIKANAAKIHIAGFRGVMIVHYIFLQFPLTVVVYLVVSGDVCVVVVVFEVEELLYGRDVLLYHNRHVFLSHFPEVGLFSRLRRILQHL